MDDSLILNFDPLNSLQRPALPTPSLPRDKENVAPDQLSMSTYFNRPYGLFSNSTSPGKQSKAQSGDLIEFSDIVEDDPDDDDHNDEDDTVKFVLDGLNTGPQRNIAQTPIKQPLVDITSPPTSNGVCSELDSLCKEDQFAVPTALAWGQASLRTKWDTPLDDILLATPMVPTSRDEWKPTPETPATARPLRTFPMVPPPPTVVINPVEEVPLSSRPASPTTSTYESDSAWTTEDEEDGLHDEEEITTRLPTITFNTPKSPIGNDPSASPKDAYLSPIPRKTSLLSPPTASKLDSNRLSLDLNLTFDIRDARFDDVSFDLVRGEVSFLGACEDSMIYSKESVPNVFTRRRKQSEMIGNEGNLLPQLTEETEPLSASCSTVNINDVAPSEERPESRASYASEERPESRASYASEMRLPGPVARPVRALSALGRAARPVAELRNTTPARTAVRLGQGRRQSLAVSATTKTAIVRAPMREKNGPVESQLSKAVNRPEMPGKLQPIRSAGTAPSRPTSSMAVRTVVRPPSRLLASAVNGGRPASSATATENSRPPVSNGMPQSTATGRRLSVARPPIPPSRPTRVLGGAPTTSGTRRTSTIGLPPTVTSSLHRPPSSRPSSRLSLASTRAPVTAAKTSTTGQTRVPATPTTARPRLGTAVLPPSKHASSSTTIGSGGLTNTSRPPSSRPASRLGLPMARSQRTQAA